MQRIDGTQIAAGVAQDLAARVRALAATGVTPRLAILVVGDEPRTRRYVAAKERKAAELGIAVTAVRLDAGNASSVEHMLSSAIERLNGDSAIHGIILQLPIPVPGIDEQELIDRIVPAKDVDGLTSVSQAALEAGRELFVPATPQGILRLLAAYKLPIADTRIAVVGQGRLVGRPLAAMLRSRGADVVPADSKTADLAAVTRGAAIVVSAVGRAGLITDAMVDPGAVLIDVGLSEQDGVLQGDITEAAKDTAALATPVVGGVGPMTVISLLANVVLAAELAAVRSA